MPNPWKPAVTVAAVVERDGRFLLVEEETSDGVRLNQPAGHLDPGETLVAGAARETLEETAFAFVPTQLVGIYLWRTEVPDGGEPTTYLRFAFAGELGAQQPGRELDAGILRTLWLTREQIAARAAEHRSPLVQRCVDDYLRGVRYPLDLLFTHPSALAPGAVSTVASTVAPSVSSSVASSVAPNVASGAAPDVASIVAPAKAGAQVPGAADRLSASAGTTRPG